MTTHRIQTFAAARELLGGEIEVDLEVGATATDLRAKLLTAFPGLATLKDFAIARNEAYASPEDVIDAGDELVIIPPVSGG